MLARWRALHQPDNGDRWTILILRDAFRGIRRFDHFHHDLGVARNLLADRLAKRARTRHERRRSVDPGCYLRLTPGSPACRRTRAFPCVREPGDVLAEGVHPAHPAVQRHLRRLHVCYVAGACAVAVHVDRRGPIGGPRRCAQRMPRGRCSRWASDPRAATRSPAHGCANAGTTRPCTTWREVVLMHAIGRIAYHGHIDNVQASWVKIGVDGVRQLLQACGNDLGGTLHLPCRRRHPRTRQDSGRTGRPRRSPGPSTRAADHALRHTGRTPSCTRGIGRKAAVDK